MAEYIDRTALGIGYADPKAFINPAHADGWNTAIQIINEAPAADVAPVVHGHWVYNPNGMDFVLGAWECSICGIKNDNLPCDRKINPYNYIGSKYCPNCGAKMDEERAFKDEVDKR